MVEMDQMPLYEFHTLYFKFWQEKDAESKMSDKDKQAHVVAKAFEQMT